MKNRPPGTQLGPDTPFDQLQIDSLEILSIVFDLEDAFNITIPDEVARNVVCIRDVVHAIDAVLRNPPLGAAPQGHQEA